MVGGSVHKWTAIQFYITPASFTNKPYPVIFSYLFCFWFSMIKFHFFQLFFLVSRTLVPWWWLTSTYTIRERRNKQVKGMTMHLFPLFLPRSPENYSIFCRVKTLPVLQAYQEASLHPSRLLHLCNSSAPGDFCLGALTHLFIQVVTRGTDRHRNIRRESIKLLFFTLLKANSCLTIVLRNMKIYKCTFRFQISIQSCLHLDFFFFSMRSFHCTYFQLLFFLGRVCKTSQR